MSIWFESFFLLLLFNCVLTLCTHIHNYSVSSVAFSPIDPDLIVSGSWDNTIKFWNVSASKCQSTLNGHLDWYFFFGKLDLCALLYLTRVLTSSKYSVSSVAFSPKDPNLVVSGSWDKTIKFWKVSSGKCLCTLAGHSNL